MEAKLAEMKIEAATATVEMAILAGKVTPAQKEAHVKMCAADSESYKAMIKDAPVVVPLDKRMSMMAGDSGDDDGDDGDDPITPEQANVDNVLNHFGGE